MWFCHGRDELSSMVVYLSPSYIKTHMFSRQPPRQVIAGVEMLWDDRMYWKYPGRIPHPEPISIPEQELHTQRGQHNDHIATLLLGSFLL